MGTNLMKQAMRLATAAHKRNLSSFPFCGTRLLIQHQYEKYFAVKTKNGDEIFRLVEEPNGNIWIMEV